MPETLAELFLLGAVVYVLYEILEPLRRRVERLMLRLIDPSKSDIIDAEVVSKGRKAHPKE